MELLLLCGQLKSVSDLAQLLRTSNVLTRDYTALRLAI